VFNENDVKDMYSLTPMQEGMLFHYLMDKQSFHYFEQTRCRLKGQLDLKLFNLAFHQLIQRHDILRTIFIYKKSRKPRQIVLKRREASVGFEDISHMQESERSRYIKSFDNKDRETGFDLSKDIPLRCSILKTSETDFVLIWSFHHIIMDGWCSAILIKEILHIYSCLKNNETVNLPTPVPYSTYIKWLERQNKGKGIHFWKTYLENYETPAVIPQFKKKKKEKTKELEHSFSIPKNLCQEFDRLSGKYGVTTNVLFRAVWGILLQKYNNTHDVVFGAVVSGRPSDIPGIEGMVGLFINTVPVRIEGEGEKRFEDLLKRVQTDMVRSRSFEYIPLAEIQSNSLLKRDLLNHIMVFENYPVDKELQQVGEKGENRLGFSINDVTCFEQTNYDLDVVVIPGEELTVKIYFNPEVYETITIENIERHLKRIMQQVTANPETRLNRIEIISSTERKRLLYEFNDTEAEYPQGKTIHGLFKEQTARTPDRIAIVAHSTTHMIHMSYTSYMTYKELNEKSNQLACLLIEKGAEPGAIVGIMVERSLEMVIGILGILKSGSAYLPIDPEYPEERIRYMLNDSSAKVLLTTRSLSENIDLKKEILYLDDYREKKSIHHSSFIIHHSNNLAYIIYTSGTTGRPKGVAIPHGPVVNRMYWIKKHYRLNENDVVLQKTAFTFDVSVCELFRWILPGAKCCILPKGGEKEPRTIIRAIFRHKVTIVDFAPSGLALFLNDIDNLENLRYLRWVFVGAEVVHPELVEAFNEIFGSPCKTRLINAYGPTEAVVDVTCFDCSGGTGMPVIPIGKPMDNVRIYILDKNDGLQPVGVPGELCINGACLARGYLNNPELTQESFVDIHPYSDQLITHRSHSSFFYRTGDLARWLPDGNIEFLGRIDRQVKIRGFRIELGEIENRLVAYDTINEAVVTAPVDEKGNIYLCAYYVSEKALTVPTLRAYLSKELPEYMIPSYFIILEKIPLTPIGKIDRKSLPQPGGTIDTGVEHEAPTNEIEKILAEIWEDELKVSRPGINDDFFQLGGHSMKAVAITTNIRRKLNIEVSLSEIFNRPTIKKLSAYLKNEEESAYSSIKPVEKREYYLLSSAQQRLFVINQFEEKSTNYNISTVMVIEGIPDVKKLENIFKILINQHESLRTGFLMPQGEPIQRIQKKVTFGIEFYQVEPVALQDSGSEEERVKRIIKEFIRPFDISLPPLLRVGLVECSARKHIFMIDIHHIISDAVSESIIIEEFSTLYMKRGITHRDLRIQYKDYALWQRGTLETEKFTKQERYWLERFTGEIPILNISTDYPRPAKQSFEGSYLNVEVSENASEKLKKMAKTYGATLYMLLLAAYNVLLYKYTSQQDIVVGSPTAGRPHPDLQRIVGMFVNMLAMRNLPRGEKTFREFLSEVKENALQAYENQDFQFEELVVRLDVERDVSRNPLFDVSFTFQNIDEEITLAEHLKISPYEFENNIAQFDLSLYAAETKDQILLTINYCSKLFKHRSIEKLSTHFLNVLEQIANNPGLTLEKVEVLSKTERDQLLYDFNRTPAGYPASKTIHGLFENQSEKTPDTIALAANSLNHMTHMTYKELNKKANQLAFLLIERGIRLRQGRHTQPIGGDAIVGIMVERSIEMIVGILGILKAGGAYLPIDPDYPEDRIRYILNDSFAKMLLTTRSLSENIDFKKEIIYLDDYNETLHAPCSMLHASPAGSSSLAYIIYTSGTTGNPKGVMVEHKHVIQLLFNDEFQFDFNSTDTWTMFHSSNFDFSVWEMYGALLYGGKLIVVPKMVAMDPGRFLNLLKKEKVTILNQVPSVFYNVMKEALTGPGQDPGEEPLPLNLYLRYVIFGGEALMPVMLNEWRKRYPRTKLINMFGITETCVHVTYKEIGIEEIELNISNIGKPLPSTRCYVMDNSLRLAPIGVPGELCVGGEGVARGYLNRPGLAVEKFVEDPYIPGQRLYRSGDLVRFTHTGEMEYLVRIDYQVQIRGYRIEPGEIEYKLLRKNEIKEAVVIDREDSSGHKYLCAYVVKGEEFEFSELREYLSQELPEYMIPNYFVPMKKIPLTKNGKVDRKRLPEPEAAVEEYIIPRSETEKQLADIWKDVLNLERAGIKDNFFQAGGDSIKAIKLISLVNKKFGTHLRIVDLYMHQTVIELADKLNKEKSGRRDEVLKEILGEIKEFEKKVMKTTGQTGDIENIFPMSDIEKGMIFHYLKNPHEAIYHDQPVYHQRMTDFDMERMRKALALMIKKHPILRTAYIVEEFAHVVYRFRPSFINAVYRDISSMDEMAQEAYFGKYLEESRNRPFNPSEPPLWRLGFFKGSQDEIVVLWEFFHAIMDGWSNALFLTELNNTYFRLKREPDVVPEDLKVGYKEFIMDQLYEKKNPGAAAYWQNELMDYKRLHFPKPAAGGESGIIRMDLGLQFREKLESFAGKYNTTLKHLCFAAYIYMLSMFSYENDMTVGVVTNNRPVCEDGDKIIGCFVYAVPVRVKIPSNIKWSDYIRLIDKKMVGLKQYDKLSLMEIVRIIGEKTGDMNPITDFCFNFINFYAFGQMKPGETQEGIAEDKLARLASLSWEKTNYPFALNIDTFAGGFLYTCEYSAELIIKQDAKRLCTYFERILDLFIYNTEDIVGNIGIIPEQEREKLLFEFNDTAADFPADKTIHLLFEEQVVRTPDNIATAAYSLNHMTHMTYKELNKSANQLAHLVIEKGLRARDTRPMGGDAIVGLMVDRSIEMIVGILGILKSGGAYMPIDPDSPGERKKYMLADSAVEVLVTTRTLSKNIDFKKELIYLDDYKGKKGIHHSSDQFIIHHSDNLAYIIYTSGTTGRPKGVAVNHAGMVNYTWWRLSTYKYTKTDITLQMLSYVFDGFYSNFYSALLSGGVLVLVPGFLESDIDDIKNTVKTAGGTNMSLVPGMYAALLRSCEASDLETLRFVVLAGEKADEGLVALSKEKAPHIRLINEYGPTEATVTAAANPGMDAANTAVIGKPITNTAIYMLDKSYRLVPIGVPGELYITGPGVARGYLNQPQLTTDTFNQDYLDKKIKQKFFGGSRGAIFQKSPPGRRRHKIYKTGDLARWLPDGNIEFLGRIDHQVKIRGFRIELGEIESQLLNIDEIKDAVVLAKEEGKGKEEKYLCAYIVTLGTVSIDLSEIRKKLSKKLPGYMIPSYFVQLEEIPLTSNGKINRKALPEPEIETGGEHTPPSNDVEKKLVKIWQEVLDVEKIGIDDIFFEIGGDSIKAIQVSARVQKYGFKLGVADLMANPTVRQSAKCLGRINRDRLPNQGIVEGRVPLTPIQKWFFSPISPASAKRLWGHFNQAVMIYRETGFDEGIVKELFAHIIAHHDALRMVYTFEKNQILQWNRGMEEPLDALVELSVIDLKGSRNPAVEIEKGANRMQRSIDLKRGPLVKLGLFKTTGGDHLLMIIHHLVVDGVSWRILLEDIAHGYSLLEKSKKLQFPGKTDSFRYWAQKQKEYSESETLLKELEYWKAVETADIPLLSKDRESTGKTPVISHDEVISIQLDESDTQTLLKEVNQAYNTEINDILLTALGLAVKEWQGKEKVAVTLEGHGRETIVEDIDISRTVGWFTSQFPVVLDMSRSKDISYAIKYVKETLRKIPNKGIGYGILRYLTPPAKRGGLHFEMEPEISFNYLGQFSQENKEKSIKISNMSTGDSISPHMERTHSLAVNGIISEGKLRLDVIYSKDEYKRPFIKKFTDCFRRHLIDIIKHCSSNREKELTPSDMDYSQLTIDTLDRLKDEIGGIQNVYKLSPMQEVMFFHSLLHKESHAFVEQIVFSIKGEIDSIILERSFNILIKQYDIFRTVFIAEGLDEPLQIVLNQRSYEMPFKDLSINDQQQYLEAFIKEDRSRGFNLSKDLLMRIFLFKTGEDSYTLVWTSHHILMDGWCMGIVFKEWVRIYEYLKKGESPPLEPPPQYGSYIKWLQQQDKYRGLDYWKKYLEGYEQTAVIPTFEKPKHGVTNGIYQPEDYGFTLDNHLSNRLREIAKKLRVTVNTLFQTIWGILLQRYNNTDDVVFGAVVSGRSSEVKGIEDMVGLFINNVPVRISMGSSTFSGLVENLHKDTLEAKAYEYLPLAEIEANSASKGNLIDHIIVFENYPLQEVVKGISTEESCGFYVDGIESFEQTNYNFNVRVIPRETIDVVFRYNSLVYERAFIENIGLHLQQVIKQVSDNPDKTVKEIEIITKEGK